MISVLILTLDEERNVADCLKSVSWSNDVVVFDSFSADKTLAIATSMGARIFQRKFDNYADQRNAALASGFKNEWLLMIDADEIVPDDLRDEMLQAIEKAPGDVDVFRMRRKDMFFGRWLRRSGGYPTWFSRLFRAGKVWIEREINEETHCKGGILNLDGHLLHYPFRKGIAFWIERHNRYSTLEALALINEVRASMRWPSLFSRDPVVRRKWLKQLAYRLPCRPFLVFLYLYVARMGFLDGLAGWHYSWMRALYEYMIDLKVTELRRRNNGAAV